MPVKRENSGCPVYPDSKTSTQRETYRVINRSILSRDATRIGRQIALPDSGVVFTRQWGGLYQTVGWSLPDSGVVFTRQWGGLYQTVGWSLPDSGVVFTRQWGGLYQTVGGLYQTVGWSLPDSGWSLPDSGVVL